jgi:predicted adenylyl cyclase CyaB
MYEAEIKLIVADDISVRTALESRVDGENEEYEDYYFTHPTIVPKGSERELRVREISRSSSKVILLTFKDEIVDAATKSKREYELQIEESAGLIQMFEAMGLHVDIHFVKRCTNWRLTLGKYSILATLVSVSELPKCYLELETLVQEKEGVRPGLDTLRTLAKELGFSEDDETLETYTECVREARGKNDLR